MDNFSLKIVHQNKLIIKKNLARLESSYGVFFLGRRYRVNIGRKGNTVPPTQHLAKRGRMNQSNLGLAPLSRPRTLTPITPYPIPHPLFSPQAAHPDFRVTLCPVFPAKYFRDSCPSLPLANPLCIPNGCGDNDTCYSTPLTPSAPPITFGYW